MKVTGPVLLELKTEPLGFEITAPIDEAHALRFLVPITPEAAQCLALALLARPEVAHLLPAVAAAIEAEVGAVLDADSALLRSMGVTVP